MYKLLPVIYVSEHTPQEIILLCDSESQEGLQCWCSKQNYNNVNNNYKKAQRLTSNGQR